MTQLEEKILRYMIGEVNAPYIWGGKGAAVWSKDGPLVGTITEPFSGRAINSYDCCGLFAWACTQAGLKDRRFTHDVKAFMHELETEPFAATMESRPLVAIIGGTPEKPTHLAVVFSLYGQAWVVQAAGGGTATTSVQEARRVNACVSCTPWKDHRPLIGLRRFPTT